MHLGGGLLCLSLLHPLLAWNTHVVAGAPAAILGHEVTLRIKATRFEFSKAGRQEHACLKTQWSPRSNSKVSGLGFLLFMCEKKILTYCYFGYICLFYF